MLLAVHRRCTGRIRELTSCTGNEAMKFFLAIIALVLVAGCSGGAMNEDKVRAFAADYAKAWSSQNAASVAAHFAPEGSISINGGPASVGREAITAVAQSFMTSFPD